MTTGPHSAKPKHIPNESTRLTYLIPPSPLSPVSYIRRPCCWIIMHFISLAANPYCRRSHFFLFTGAIQASHSPCSYRVNSFHYKSRHCSCSLKPLGRVHFIQGNHLSENCETRTPPRPRCSSPCLQFSLVLIFWLIPVLFLYYNTSEMSVSTSSH